LSRDKSIGEKRRKPRSRIRIGETGWTITENKDTKDERWKAGIPGRISRKRQTEDRTRIKRKNKEERYGRRRKMTGERRRWVRREVKGIPKDEGRRNKRRKPGWK
jgi:hypothetical protein